jgi:membrane-bound metal-dependent hydrolase YbcI (DUF457 family)
MKGIAHFMSGVAVATFFPWTLAAANDGNPMYFILGGAFGILPDTLDFKFYRFFYKHDLYIQPDPRKADPQEIADQIAGAMADAMESDRMIRVKCSSIRLGADYWQQYTVKFDAEKREVSVQFGPVVNTGQVPVPGTEPENPRVGVAKLPCELDVTYDASATVDIFDGPTFGFEKSDAGVTFHFLPWHREWTHALTMGVFFALLALLGCALYGLMGENGLSAGLVTGAKAAAVIVGAYAAHVLEDQLGFMGSNLFYPFTKKRSQGIHIMRSGDSLPNFTTVWLSVLLMFWNMYRYSAEASIYNLNLFTILFFGGVLPVAVFWFVLKVIFKQEAPLDAKDTIDADEWEETASV